MAEGRAVSIQAALEADETPEQDAQEVVLHDPSTEALRRLSGALDTIARLEQTNQQLERKVSALLERLEQGDPNTDELRRMNAFLMADLERARGVPAPEKAAANTDDGATGKIDGEREGEATDDGLLVRTARWLERRLRGGRPPRE